MKTKIRFLAITMLMASIALPSCFKGDKRDYNLQQATLTHLDSIPEVQYVGMSDGHTLNDNKFRAIVIYYIIDAEGNKVECNARVTTNYDCTEIYTWEALDCQVIGEVKQKISDKFREKGISMDGSLIDAILEFKNK